MPELPMFPLGTVLFPHALLPLHVFEPRYRALVTDVLAGDGEFGVVLIRRGSEVGGGDEREDLGTLARVVQAEQLGDGRWLLVAVGVERLQVERWLQDDPYPRAQVTWRSDRGSAPVPEDLVARLGRVLALRAELGEPVMPATAELADDPTVRAWQLAAAAPLTSYDAQRLLGIDDHTSRLAHLDELLAELEASTAFRLGPEET